MIRAAAAALCLALLADAPEPRAALRVCADPNNLPFSNQKGEGFENRIADLVAAELGLEVRYTWWAQRRGFVRNTLRAESCDLIPGVPEGFEPVATTAPYYRSTYVFVTRPELQPAITSLDDPRLHRLQVGVHLIGDDYSNPPPVAALARRDIVRNVRGFSIYGDYRDPNPPARLLEAVAKGEVDVAIVWGPFGGYFAGRVTQPLRVTPVEQTTDDGVPFTFAIAMGVRPGDSVLANRVQQALTRRHDDVREILRQYGVPLVADSGART